MSGTTNRKGRVGGLLGTVSLAALAASPALAAQTEPATPVQVEEIIVTAQKRSENLQQVPMSITAVSQQKLESANVATLTDLQYALPNVAIANGTSANFTTVTVRGIGILPRNIGFDSGFGVYVDGVSQGRQGAFDVDLFDVSQVEVLRGPQGTLYGRNIITGLMNLSTRAPDPTTFGARIQLGLGNFSAKDLRGVVNLPLGEAWALRIAASRRARDGWVDNQLGTDLNSVDLAQARARISGEVGRLKIDLSADVLRDRGWIYLYEPVVGPNFVEAPGPREVAFDTQNRSRRDIEGGSIKLDYETADGMTVTSISALRRQAADGNSDEDRSSRFLAASLRFLDEEQLVSQEFRLTSPKGGRVSYIVGAYAQRSKASTDRLFALGPALFGGQVATRAAITSTAYALFANAKLDLSERFSVTGGLRYSAEQKRLDHYDQTNTTLLIGAPPVITAGRQTISKHVLTPEVTFNLHLDNGALVYARYAQGYKAGGFNADLLTTAANLSFGPETLRSTELGFKSDLFNRRLRLNGALFHIAYDDMQVQQLDLTTHTLAVRNAASATSNGFELEAELKLDARWSLEGSLGYADAKYDKYVSPTLGDLSGTRIARSPPWTGALAVTYSGPEFGPGLRLNGRLSADYRDAQYTLDGERRSDRAGGFTLVNARLTLASDQRWSVSAWSNNLLGRTYIDRRLGTRSLGGDLVAGFGQPRTFGLELNYDF